GSVSQSGGRSAVADADRSRLQRAVVPMGPGSAGAGGRGHRRRQPPGDGRRPNGARLRNPPKYPNGEAGWKGYPDTSRRGHGDGAVYGSGWKAESESDQPSAKGRQEFCSGRRSLEWQAILNEPNHVSKDALFRTRS